MTASTTPVTPGTHEMGWVDVYSVPDANLAEIIKAHLEQEGIACWIEGENQAGLAGILPIRLLVRAGDAERARVIVDTFDHPISSD